MRAYIKRGVHVCSCRRQELSKPICSRSAIQSCIERLKPKIYEIDHIIGDILGLRPEDVESVEKAVEVLIERRVSGAKEAAPGSVKGEEEPRIKPPKRVKRESRKEASVPLDKFIN